MSLNFQRIRANLSFFGFSSRRGNFLEGINANPSLFGIFTRPNKDI